MSGWSLLIGMRPWLMSGFVTPFGNDFHIAMVYITIKSDDLPMKHFMIFPIAMFFLSKEYVQYERHVWLGARHGQLQ